MIIILLLIGWSLPCSWAQAPEELWQSAAEQFNSGNYSTAIANYQLIEKEVASSELYYNMGNSYYLLDSVALSILYFEKAIKLNPRDRTARENLELAVELMHNPIPAIEEFFLKRWLNSLSDLLPPMGWGILCVLILWTIVWMLVRSVRRNTLRKDRLRYALPVAALVISLLTGYVAYQNQTTSDYAVVMESIEVKVAPDALSAVTRTVSEGEKVLIMDKLDDFYKVRFVNYEHGWLPESAVRRI